MKTALDVLRQSIEDEKKGTIYISSFSFLYEKVKIDYYGRYYGYASREGFSEEYEFGADSYDSMLNEKIPFTGKSIREMLAGLRDCDLQLDIDPNWNK